METAVEKADELSGACRKSQPNARKRRHSEITDCDAAAVIETGPGCNSPNTDDVHCGAPATKYRELESGVFRIDQFSDEVLFEIFKNLDSWTLLALMNCCYRFNSLVQDHRFWNHIDLSKEPLPLGMLEGVLERTHCRTHTVRLRGPPPAQHVDGEIQQFNKTIVSTFSSRCTQLSVLELQGVTIDFRIFRIIDFPKTLKRLMLIDCNVCIPDPEGKNIFSGIDTHLMELEELGIEYSDWFDPQYIMTFSKVPQLRWLSMKGCQHMVQFVAYGSIAARFGFKQLEYLDLRFTPITNSDLQCFNAVGTLKEILLDCPQNLRNLKNGTEGANVSTEEPSSSATATHANSGQSSVSGPASTSSSSSQLNVTISLSPSSSGVSGPANISIQNLRPVQNDQDSPSSSSSSSSPSSSSSSSPSSSSSSSSASNSPSNPYPASPLVPVVAVANGSLPSNSRFLPRPDQIIYLDVHNRRRPIIMHGPPRRPPNNQADQLDQVLMNPNFWDMINPLGRRGQNPAVSVGNRPNDAASVTTLRRNRNTLRDPISDRGICCFGRPPNPVDDAIIWIRIGYRPSENRFERLSVRNYKRVTDISLQHLVQCSPHLVFLDLSGTGVTKAGVQKFKERKPECQIVADHLIGIEDDDSLAEPENGDHN